ncbi:extracellular catalytic domain type 1 short-chain-length polyhydroxyalkanoate depolymerase [Oceanisphaera profunda]|nr:PHB depolymerase family esterase [Oceanisphaera profunda]
MNLPLNEKFMASLKQATWLTQSGQLQEATAMIQRALQGEQMPQATEPTSAKGEIFEGSFYVVDEQYATPEKASAGRKGAQPESMHSNYAQPGSTQTHSAQTKAPRKPFAAASGISGLSSLLRGKLSGLSGLNAGVDLPAETLADGATAFAPSMSGLSSLLRGKLSGLQGLNTGVDVPVEVLPEGATFNSGTFANQAGSRDYKLYVPSGYHGQQLPLIVMLHGCTQNPDDFAAGTGMNILAEQQPCLVLYPAQSGCANSSRCWNWFKPGDQHRDGGEPAIIAGLTRQIINEYHLDEGRVYVAGLSAGGAMATTMALLYPDIYAAVGIHSGLAHGAAQDIPSALAAMQGTTSPLAGLNKQASAQPTSSKGPKIPAIIFHGDQDTTVHPSNGDRVVAQYLPVGRVTNSKIKAERRAGKVPNGRSYTCTIHHDASGQPILEQWSIHGAAHAWAGGTARGSYTDPQGPDASREMLRFFLAHGKGEH